MVSALWEAVARVGTSIYSVEWDHYQEEGKHPWENPSNNYLCIKRIASSSLTGQLQFNPIFTKFENTGGIFINDLLICDTN